jgi:hypothetical protein
VNAALRDASLRAGLLAVDNIPAHGSADAFASEIRRRRAP